MKAERRRYEKDSRDDLMTHLAEETEDLGEGAQT